MFIGRENWKPIGPCIVLLNEEASTVMPSFLLTLCFATVIGVLGRVILYRGMHAR